MVPVGDGKKMITQTGFFGELVLGRFIVIIIQNLVLFVVGMI